MGTVHGVYLKYVALSALSYAGFSYISGHNDPSVFLARSLEGGSQGNRSLLRLVPAVVLGYSTIVNGAIAVLFKMERGMEMLGKDRVTGQVPLWSKLVWFPFHGPTRLYTWIHTRTSTFKIKSGDGKAVERVVPVATEVQPGWWVGGCYGHEIMEDGSENKGAVEMVGLKNSAAAASNSAVLSGSSTDTSSSSKEPKQWAAVIDLTVEFSESCRQNTFYYLSAPTWDGVPASPKQLEDAATLAVKAKTEHPGHDVLVHCAHGRGRSTTVMCACLVKAGLYPNWQEAFEKGIKPYRTVCKLNKRMRENLTVWQAIYVDKTAPESDEGVKKEL